MNVAADSAVVMLAPLASVADPAAERRRQAVITIRVQLAFYVAYSIDVQEFRFA